VIAGRKPARDGPRNSDPCFRRAGLKSADAERIATEIYDAIHDKVATKDDRREFEQCFKIERRALEQRLELRFEQIDKRFVEVDRRIDMMLARLGALAVVLLGLLFGALHLWPPHP
jgi:hypothetical protein